MRIYERAAWPPSLRLGRSATVVVAVICLGQAGCIIPLPSKTTRGHHYPSEVLGFLSNPGVSREEVLAEFGPPLYESEMTRTLVYDWEQTPRYLVPVPHVIHRDVEFRGEVVQGDSDRVGLFIAYDERGVVLAHQTRTFTGRTVKEACERWRRSVRVATADRPEPGKGLVIFYCEGHSKSGGVGLVIFDIVKEPTGTALGSGPQMGGLPNGSYIAYGAGLPNGSYIVYNATPGEHAFAISTMARQLHYRQVDIESNRVYYVRAELVKSRTGGVQSPELTVVDSQEGSAAIKNLKRVNVSQ